MAINKVVYGGKTLIDLAADTVASETLLTGRTAHMADGTIITGTLLEGHPDEYHLYEPLLDSDGDDILDSDSDAIEGATVYRKV